MALNSSGPISLGGSTAGQSVNLELGQSATTTISFNDANVRTLTGTISGSALSMPGGFWGKSSGPVYFISAYTYTGTKMYGRSVTSDSSGNFYLSTASPTSSTWASVFKYDNTGAYSNNTYWSYGAPTLNSTSVVVDDATGVLYSGQTQINGQGGYSKFNGSSLSLTSSVFTSHTNTWDSVMAIDSTKNTIVVQPHVTTPKSFTSIYKFDSSGNIVWQKVLENASLGVYMGCISLDSSDNIYLGGYLSDSSPTSALMTKISAAGAVLWSYSFATTAGYGTRFTSVSASPNGYVYAGTRGFGSSSSEPNMGSVFVYTSSGVYNASRGFYSTQAANISSISSDSSGAYVCLSATDTIQTGSLLKIDNLATGLWSNKLTQTAGGSSSGRVGIYATKVTSNGGLAVTGGCYGAVNTTQPSILMCVPTDGSHRGSTSLVVGAYTFLYEANTAVTTIPISSQFNITPVTLTLTNSTDTVSSITVSTSTLSGAAAGPTTV